MTQLILDSGPFVLDAGAAVTLAFGQPVLSTGFNLFSLATTYGIAKQNDEYQDFINGSNSFFLSVIMKNKSAQMTIATFQFLYDLFSINSCDNFNNSMQNPFAPDNTRVPNYKIH